MAYVQSAATSSQAALTVLAAREREEAERAGAGEGDERPGEHGRDTARRPSGDDGGRHAGQLADGTREGQHGRARTRGRARDASPHPCTAVTFRALPLTGRANSSSTALRVSRCCSAAPGSQRRQTPAPTPTAKPVVRPFAALAEQRVIVAPASRINEADPLGLARPDPAHARIPAYAGRRDRRGARRARAQVAVGLPGRPRAGGKAQPDVRGGSRTRSRPNRCARRMSRRATKLREPLATQLRTMIALQDARVVLAARRAAVREATELVRESPCCSVALLDGRVERGRAGSATCGATPSADVLARRCSSSLAAHFADLIAAP